MMVLAVVFVLMLSSSGLDEFSYDSKFPFDSAVSCRRMLFHVHDAHSGHRGA